MDRWAGEPRTGARSSRLGLLRDPDFPRLFLTTALGQLGDRLIFLALPLVAIVALDADEFQVGLRRPCRSARQA
ncbi:hypothetical protein [Streptomyces sp. R08]|uniref:MFS transporter n=1 Tax=Streptomyces sp. R08 TaxID=3238624 RepID=A0AB39MH19_9ACTN